MISYSLWKKYLEIIEEHMTDFQANEGLNDREFKNAVEEVGERHPFLVKLMIASWEFPQFLEMCREYVNEHDDCTEAEGKVRPPQSLERLLSFFQGGGGKYDEDDKDAK
jgi:hypothetical protein